MQETKKIGLTLSGGGARGAAHIGIIKALEEANIHPTHIVGVSAGAIVGALYAAGKSPEEMMDFISESSMIKLIRLGIPTTGLTTMDYLRERLKAILPQDDFAALGKSLHVGVTNLEDGRFELHDSGKLHDMVAASCSIPFVFKPMSINGTYYVDGGIVNNMPVSPLEGKVDYIIGSNLTPINSVARKELSSVISISWRCFDLSIMANTQAGRGKCDLLFEPSSIAAYSIFAFSKIKELYEIGYQHAKSVLKNSEITL
ncbi:MAG: patatin-like phospholipase family protein [Bacteroidota bacterium]